MNKSSPWIVIARVSLCAALLPVLWVGPVGAQPSDGLAAEPVEDIDALFAQAAEAFKGERYEQALELLVRISASKPDPIILFNIARCHEELAHTDQAIAAFEVALAADLSEAQRQDAQARLERLKAEASRPPEVVPDPVEPGPVPDLVLGVHAGVTAPQPFGDLKSAPTFGIEVGLTAPFDLGSFLRPLQFSFGMSVTNPKAEGVGVSPALGPEGASFEWALEQRMLMLEVSATWRFIPLTEDWSPFAQLGPRLYLMESIMTASSGGGDFGESRETSTAFGFFISGGVDFALGPGSAFGALDLGGSDLDQTITGDLNTGALSARLGYRLHF